MQKDRDAIREAVSTLCVNVNAVNALEGLIEAARAEVPKEPPDPQSVEHRLKLLEGRANQAYETRLSLDQRVAKLEKGHRHLSELMEESFKRFDESQKRETAAIKERLAKLEDAGPEVDCVDTLEAQLKKIEAANKAFAEKVQMDLEDKS